jgi:hypothetical protein
VADIGGQDIDDVIDALMLLLTAHQGAAEEGVPKVVHARQGIVAAPDPT